MSQIIGSLDSQGPGGGGGVDLGRVFIILEPPALMRVCCLAPHHCRYSLPGRQRKHKMSLQTDGTSLCLSSQKVTKPWDLVSNWI